MSETRNQRITRAETLPVDRSMVLHRFPDGWSVRELTCKGDLHREGMLMGHCWNQLNLMEECGLSTENEFAAFFAGPQRSTLYRRCSLRDPDNLPRCSFVCRVQDGALHVHDALGRHNAPPRQSYLRKIGAWAQTSGMRVFSNGVLNEYLAA